MEEKRQFLVIALFLCSVILAGVSVSINTEKGLLGNVITGNVVEFIEGFYYSQPLSIAEKTELLEPVEPELAPFIEFAQIVLLGDGRKELEIRGSNLQYTKNILLDSIELSPQQYRISETTQNIYLNLEQGLLEKEHTILVITEYGESNTYILELRPTFEEPANPAAPILPPSLELPLAEDSQSRSIEQILNEYDIPLHALIPSQLPFANTQRKYVAPQIKNDKEETTCQISSVEWITQTSTIGSTASFIVQGEGCDGKSISYGVIERDYFSQDDIVPYQSEVFFQNGKATGTVFLEEQSFGKEIGGFERDGEFSVYFGDLNNQEGITGRATTTTGPSVFSNTLIVGQSGGQGTGTDGPQTGINSAERYSQRVFGFKGCSDIHTIDEDCDGRYAAGINTTLGSYYRNLDPDDTDPLVYDQETLYAQYGTFNDALSISAYLAAIGYTPQAGQNIFFIDPINGDDTTGQPNDITKPYRTLNEIICEDQGTGQLLCQKSIASGSEKIREIQSGDTVLFREGNYDLGNLNLNDSRGYNLKGTINAPILLKAYPGEKVTFNGLYLPGLEISNGPESDNLIIDGFKIISTPGLGVYIGEGDQQNLEFRNLELTTPNQTAYTRPAFEIHPEGNKKNLYFKGVVIHGFYYGGISIFTNGSIKNMTIINSKFYNNNGHLVTRGNITDSAIEQSSFVSSSGFSLFFIDGFQRGVIRNNLFFNGADREILILALPFAGFNVHPFTGNLITNNVFWKNNQTNHVCTSTLNCPPYAYPKNSSNVLFLHIENPSSTDPYRAATGNAFVNNIFGVPGGESAIEYQSTFNTSLAVRDLIGSVVINNILYSSVTGTSSIGPQIVGLCNMTDGSHDQTRISNGAGDCLTTMYYWTANIPGIPILNNTLANPLFADVQTNYALQPQLFNFKLLDTSPARDYSFGPLAPQTDIQGNARLNNPDIGAYEVLGNAICTPQTQTQTCNKQQGVCSGATETCQANGAWNGCTFYNYYAHNSSYELTETLCDGLDNDCDGLTDEGNICPPTQNFLFSISANPSSGDLSFGPSTGTNSIQVILTKIGNAPNEEITMSITGLPTGATYNFAGQGQDATCDFANSNTCTLTLQLSADEQVNSIPDQFSIVITGTSNSYTNSTNYVLTLDKNSPELTLITPSTLTAGSTTTLAITGNNFDNTLELTENSITLGTTSSANPSNAEFAYTVPSTPGIYNLAITNQNGKTSNPYTVQVISQSIPLPQELSPNWARETQTKTVQLTGASFSSTDTIYIDGIQTSSTYIDQNNLQVTIPSTLLLGEHTLTVENNAGQSQGSIKLYILEQEVPALDYVTPKRINNAYSQGISFTGENFSVYSGFQVNLGGNWITYPFTETLPMNETLLRAFFQGGYPVGTYQVRIIRHDYNVSNPIELEIFNQNIPGPTPDFDLDGIQDNQDQCRKTQIAYHPLINRHGCPQPTFNQLANSMSTNITSLQSLINVGGFRIGVRNEALIEFKENVTLLRQIPEFLMYHPLNIDAGLQITNKTVHLNATALFELNVPSRLTFFNTTLTNPVPRRDGAICSGQCTPVSFVQSTGEFSFDTTGFSTYTVSQGTCGDGYCSITETQSTCSTDCGGGNTGGSSGGSGGGSSGGGGGSGGGSGGGTTRIEKINLDTTKTGQTTIIKGTKIDLTYKLNVYRVEITDIQNETVTFNFVNDTRILVAQNLELYSVNLDAETKEDIELYITKNGNEYTVTFSKIEEQTQTGEQTTPSTNNNPGGRGPVIEQPSPFNLPKAGYWTMIIGITLVIFILIFLDLKLNGKQRTTLQTIPAQKPAQRPYKQKEIKMTTLLLEKKEVKTNTQNTPPQKQPFVQQTPTPVYRYVTSRPRNVPMTEIQGPKEQLMPQTQTIITPPKKQPIQQISQPAQNTIPPTTSVQSIPRMVSKPGETVQTKTVQVPQEVKEKILNSSKEESEEFDPYA